MTADLMFEYFPTWRFLRAVADDVVYFDPAHSIYADGPAKVSPQWRISTSDFADKLARLY